MSGLVEHLKDIGDGLGLSFKRMFGGQGVYRDGLFIGLIADEVLYIRTDDLNVARFDAAGLGPFSYHVAAKAKDVVLARYRRAPDAALEDRDELAEWLRLGDEAAARYHAANPKRPAKPKRAAAPRRRNTGSV
jgi:DNA transformation protein